MLVIDPRLRNVVAAEGAILEHLAEHMEDRFIVGSILDPADFLLVEHQQIFASIYDIPLTVAGNHAGDISEALLWQANIEALECFSNLRSVDFGSWMVALQVSTYVLIHAYYRRDAERVLSQILDTGEDGLW